MRKIIFISLFILSLVPLSLSFPAPSVYAQEASIPKDEYLLGKVTSLSRTADSTNLTVVIIKGTETGKKLAIEIGDNFLSDSPTQYHEGDEVVVNKSYALDSQPTYYLTDRYRLPNLFTITAIFFFLVILLGGRHGIGSIAGLASTMIILIKFIVPSLISGQNPILVTYLGAVAIAILSLYLAHGFNKRTSIAVISTLLTLSLATFLAYLFVINSFLSGGGTEEAVFLQVGVTSSINLQGLLLGGIIIGTLGVLDDITTSQTAALDEIYQANPKQSLSELLKRGFSVGREHIASLVNTLVLAYAGASLPLFLLFTTNSIQPLWVVLNSEFLAEEIVRTIVGSTALVLAVPITTLLTAIVLKKYGALAKHVHTHHH